MRYYDPFSGVPTKKNRARQPRMDARRAPSDAVTPRDEVTPRNDLFDDEAQGDTFLSPELQKAVKESPQLRRARQNARMRGLKRRPTPPAPLDLSAETGAESWDFGADPMLWARTRYGERAVREKLFADAKPYRGPSAWIGRIFRRSELDF